MAHAIVLQHVAPETCGLLGDALAEAGVEPRVVRVFAGEPIPRDLGDAAALVVMGGPMGVYEADRYPYLKEEMRLIEKALAAERPVLGICLGSQLLAATLGARVAPSPEKEIGWFAVRLSAEAREDPLFSTKSHGHDQPSFAGSEGAPEEIVAFHWHGDRFDLPRGAVSLGSSERTPVQGFRHGACAYGLLFHMEVTRRLVADMLEAFADEIETERLDAASILAESDQRLALLSPVAQGAFAAFAAIARVSAE